MKQFRQSAIKEKLFKRAKIIQAIRSFFISKGYLEVETPIRIPAPAPESNIDPIETEAWFLQTSPELCMKRLLSAGYSNIFQICKCFRSSERGKKHLPELTLLEWYSVQKNYSDLMAECEELIKYITEKVEKKKSIIYQKKVINIHLPWEKLTVGEAFKKYADKDVKSALSDDTFDEIMGLKIEPMLGHHVPTILYDYPAEKGALAKLNSADTSIAERFELYISGLELCNAFSELTDPLEQRRRFENEIKERLKSGKAALTMPEPFIDSLNYMPEAAGIAFGIDRLVMIFTDSIEIDEVTTFVPEEL